MYLYYKEHSSQKQNLVSKNYGTMVTENLQNIPFYVKPVPDSFNAPYVIGLLTLKLETPYSEATIISLESLNSAF